MVHRDLKLENILLKETGGDRLYIKVGLQRSLKDELLLLGTESWPFIMFIDEEDTRKLKVEVASR